MCGCVCVCVCVCVYRSRMTQTVAQIIVAMDTRARKAVTAIFEWWGCWSQNQRKRRRNCVVCICVYTSVICSYVFTLGVYLHVVR